jgi:hypothetical protein
MGLDLFDNLITVCDIRNHTSVKDQCSSLFT